ncbi:MAG TPA: hydrogenase iron-sulfur subunit [Candidatus Deferrimicrobium sp.]|nr:hydrogenase iron-sulfur subunit [Candidatus Deferrimicrobium sp.]
MVVGVVICDCGEKLAKIIDYNAISGAFKNLKVPNIKISNLCLDPGIGNLKTFVQKNSVDKLVVGACTPKLIEYKLRQAISSVKEFEFVILREHIAWPNKANPEKATKKAIILLKAAVAALNTKEKIKQETYPVEKSAIIIGGGIAGLQAALDLASEVKVYLIEKEETLGGNLRNMGKVFPGEIVIQDVLNKKIEHLKANSNVTIYTNTNITEIFGKPGDYEVTIETPSANSTVVLKSGAIVVATGIEESKPIQLDLGYGKCQDIILQSDLALMLKEGRIICPSTGKKPKQVLMGNCINCRDENHFYCSNICCTYSIHHAMELLEQNIESIICYMDIRAPYKFENLYRQAREKGVTFIRGKLQSIEVGPNGELMVPVENTLTSELYELTPDLLVLSSALVPAEGSEKLAEMLGLKTKESCFISNLYSKTNTSQTTQRGIFIAGSAFTPMNIQDSISHASSAAVKTMKFLKEGTLTRDLLVPTIDEDLCNGCATCRDTCQFNAIVMIKKSDTDTEIVQIASVDPTKCKGCGTCSAVCPTGATQLANYQRGVIFTKIETIMNTIKEDQWADPVIIALTCEECGSCGIDIAGLSGFEYPVNVFNIDVPCAGRIGVIDILKAFVDGADAVLVVQCPEQSCHFMFGSHNTNLMVQFTKNILNEIGFESERLANIEMVSSDPDKYVKSIEKLNDIIKKVGPNPNK